MAALPQQLDGKYEILEKIKEGGMGAVYKVRHRFLDEIRVVKVIRSSLEQNQELSDRFLREARMAIRLRHPSIAILHDFAVADDGKALIFMEYIAGLTLEEVVRAGGPPPLGLTLEVASQALRAMGYLHRRGFVHRDIAPDNLMLTRGVDGEPLVKLIDLGIAKMLAGDGPATTAGIFLGKPRYASPEHFGTRKMDHRSDLYSFGVVLYELLTGQCPIAGHDPASYMAGHLFEPPLDFAESDPQGAVPAELHPIVLRALAKKTAERFASAADFARAIAPLQDRFPALAGDLEAALEPPPEKRAQWSPPPRSGSSRVLLDPQFMPGTAPPPAAGRDGSLDETLPLTTRQRMPVASLPTSPRSELPPRMPPPVTAEMPLQTPTLIGAPAMAPSGTAVTDSLALPTAPPPTMPSMPSLPAATAEPASEPRQPPRSLAAWTLASVLPAQPIGEDQLRLPAGQRPSPAPAGMDWESAPLHRTEPPRDQWPASAAPGLSFKAASGAPPAAAVRRGRRARKASRVPRAAWVYAGGALLLVAGALGGGAWWSLRHQARLAGGGAVQPGRAVQRGGAVQPDRLRSGGTVQAGGIVQPGGAVLLGGAVQPDALRPGGAVQPRGAVQQGGAIQLGGAVESDTARPGRSPQGPAGAVGAPAAAPPDRPAARPYQPPAAPASNPAAVAAFRALTAGRCGPMPDRVSALPAKEPSRVSHAAKGPARASALPAERAAKESALPSKGAARVSALPAKVAARQPPSGPDFADAPPSFALGTPPARQAGRAAPPDAVAPEPLQGPGVQTAEPVDVRDAIYPAAARGTGMSPTVLMAVEVDTKGNVAEVRIKEGDASNLGFNEAAVAAAWKARYLPATRHGVPVFSWSELMIEFVSPPPHH